MPSALTEPVDVAREWFAAALDEDLERIGELTVARTRHLMRSDLYGLSGAWRHYAGWDWPDSVKRLPSDSQLAAVAMTPPDVDDYDELHKHEALGGLLTIVLEDTADGWQVVTFTVGLEDDGED